MKNKSQEQYALGKNLSITMLLFAIIGAFISNYAWTEAYVTVLTGLAVMFYMKALDSRRNSE